MGAQAPDQLLRWLGSGAQSSALQLTARREGAHLGGSGECGVRRRPETASPTPLFPASPQGLAALGSRALPPKKRALLSGVKQSVCPAIELGARAGG